MDTWLWIVIAIVAVVLVVAVIGWSKARQRRTQTLREGFGPEYDRTLEDTGSRRRAEAELRERQERREQLEVRALSPAARDRYVTLWQGTQARFVDDPGGAVAEADRLVQEVMRERGYPADDFDQRAADISVDHPHVFSNYRTPHEISLRNDRGEASTEDLRQSMVHYRSLFEELLETESEPVVPGR